MSYDSNHWCQFPISFSTKYYAIARADINGKGYSGAGHDYNWISNPEDTNYPTGYSGTDGIFVSGATCTLIAVGF